MTRNKFHSTGIMFLGAKNRINVQKLSGWWLRKIPRLPSRDHKCFRKPFSFRETELFVLDILEKRTSFFIVPSCSHEKEFAFPSLTLIYMDKIFKVRNGHITIFYYMTTTVRTLGLAAERALLFSFIIWLCITRAGN